MSTNELYQEFVEAYRFIFNTSITPSILDIYTKLTVLLINKDSLPLLLSNKKANIIKDIKNIRELPEEIKFDMVALFLGWYFML